jgi:hypothetical protein
MFEDIIGTSKKVQDITICILYINNIEQTISVHNLKLTESILTVYIKDSDIIVDKYTINFYNAY